MRYDSTTSRREKVELAGGPHDGLRVTATVEADAVLFHDAQPVGSMAAYRRTGRSTADGLPIFSWTGTAPPRGRRR